MGTKLVRSKEEIVSILLSHKKEFETFGVRRIGLFGSFLKNTQRKESDVDLLVEFMRGKKNFRNFMELAFFLEDLLNRKVELVTPESLSPYLKPAILKEIEYVVQ
ncbi:MAG TPA: nucleotidyltransferase family protein [Thermodesulfovibrionales bacterium]|nr:nucleotidyltransferase family protein [Thermodesulfovibrionales bacterium]